MGRWPITSVIILLNYLNITKIFRPSLEFNYSVAANNYSFFTLSQMDL